MKAGELRHRITIQQKTVTQDTAGVITETWADLVTVWAAIEPLTGREKFLAQQVYTDMTTRVRIRYRSGIDPAMRLKYNSRIFEINVVVNPEERNRELELLCTERGLGNV